MMQVYKSSHIVKSYAGTETVVAMSLVLKLVEALKNALTLFYRNTGASVGNANLQILTVGLFS